MSDQKIKLIAMEEMYEKAKDILLQIGVIKTCFCGAYFYETYNKDKNEIYAIATNKYKQKFGNNVNFQILQASIKKVLDDAGTENNCPICSNN